MLKSSKEAVMAFEDAFLKSQTSVGGGRTSIVMEDVQDLVRSAPNAAHDFVLLQCTYAQAQPAALQSAMIIAATLKQQTGDDSMLEQVKQVAEALGKPEILKRIEVLKL
jgi:hypothetical protein